MAFVLLAIILALVLVGIFRPYIGLLALVIVMELQPGELYPVLVPLHLERIVAVLVLVAFLLHGVKLRFPTPIRWFLAFFGAMIVSIPLAFWRTGAILECIAFLEIVVVTLFEASLLTTEKRLRWFVLTFVLLIDWLGGSALYNYHHGIWLYAMNIERAIGITSSAGDPNSLATTILTTIPLGIALMARSNALWMRLVGVGSILLGLFTIVDTGSRTAALGVVFLAVLLMCRKPKSLLLLPIFLALGPAVWMVIPQQYKARYETIDNLKGDESYQLRVLSWQGGIAMFESNPITGVGAGNYVTANGSKFWPGTGTKHWLNAHSLFFKLIGELGLIGFVTFVGYVICLFRLNWQLRNNFVDQNASHFLKILPSMCSIIFLQLLFAGYSSHDLYRGTWYFVGAITAGLSLLPNVTQRVAAAESANPNVPTPPVIEQEWSPSLLPALRRQISA